MPGAKTNVFSGPFPEKSPRRAPGTRVQRRFATRRVSGLWILPCALLLAAPASDAPRRPWRKPDRELRLKTTGYCPCGRCCNWRRNWLGRPVIASGPNRGKPKAVGITASGTRARPGTVAADTNLFPFGTIVYVPRYGYGRVEDVGERVRGYHLDLFFRSHRRAQAWGVQTNVVRVWYPPRSR